MARDNLTDRSISGRRCHPGRAERLYLCTALYFFNYMYVGSRRSGQFAKLGT